MSEIRKLAVQVAVDRTGHRPCLFFRQRGGVVVVLTPEEVRRTMDQRLTPRRWKGRQGDFYPARHSYVFVSDEGAQVIRRVAGQRVLDTKVVGTIADFKHFCDEFSVRLEEEKRIFIPWVERAILPLEIQEEWIDDSVGADLFKELIAKQFPDDVLELLLTAS